MKSGRDAQPVQQYMRKEGVSYQDMFRRIKNTLVTQRKVIRAAGRDAGDQMKLSRDKINDLSHKIVAALRKSRDFRLKRDPNDVRLEMVKIITELLQTEEKVDRAARTKIRTQKREITEGTEEWELLHKRYYAEELKKLGIDLDSALKSKSRRDFAPRARTAGRDCLAKCRLSPF